MACSGPFPTWGWAFAIFKGCLHTQIGPPPVVACPHLLRGRGWADPPLQRPTGWGEFARRPAHGRPQHSLVFFVVETPYLLQGWPRSHRICRVGKILCGPWVRFVRSNKPPSLLPKPHRGKEKVRGSIPARLPWPNGRRCRPPWPRCLGASPFGAGMGAPLPVGAASGQARPSPPSGPLVCMLEGRAARNKMSEEAEARRCEKSRTTGRGDQKHPLVVESKLKGLIRVGAVAS